MTAWIVDRCGLCDSTNLEQVLSLGSSPPPCVMQEVGSRVASETRHPLELLRCRDCTLVQMSVAIAAETVFPPAYPYSSGNSKALHSNFKNLAWQAGNWHHGLTKDDLVVDIGANDGTLLSKFDGCRKVGVEPTVQAVRMDCPAYVEFFTAEVAYRIVKEHGQAKVVTACNVLAHVEDIHDVMQGINILLADDGVLIAENHDLKSVVGGQWDTIYHEHLRYWDPHTFSRLLLDHGLGVYDCHEIPTHGGSFRTMAGKETVDILPPREYDWDAFRERTNRFRWLLRSAVSALRAGGKRVTGIGATARATTIINACGFDENDIEAVYEVAGSDKIGLYVPGTRIPIVDEAELTASYGPSHAILFSWHLADAILPKLRDGADPYLGTIIVPLPELRYITPKPRKGVTVV